MTQSQADTLQTIELADGVEIRLRVAGASVRAMAWLVDALWLILCFFGIGLIQLICTSFISPEAAEGVRFLLSFFTLWFYHVVFEIGRKGATPGKRVFGLRVISCSGAPVTLPQSIIRNFLRFADFLPMCYLTGLLCCLFTKRFQRLGDLVADTVVVYADQTASAWDPTRAVSVSAQPPRAPLHREEQVALLQFLERAPQWSDERKIELANLLEPLTGATGMEGVRRLCANALWLHDPNATAKPAIAPKKA